jgi:hypothetical protein
VEPGCFAGCINGGKGRDFIEREIQGINLPFPQVQFSSIL